MGESRNSCNFVDLSLDERYFKTQHSISTFSHLLLDFHLDTLNSHTNSPVILAKHSEAVPFPSHKQYPTQFSYFAVVPFKAAFRGKIRGVQTPPPPPEIFL